MQTWIDVRRARTVLMALSASVLLVAPALAKNHEQTDWDDDTGEDFHWSWTLPAGQSIEIKGINGDIRATHTDGKQVEVRAHKHGHHSDPREVKIEVVEHDGGITVCAVYPGSGNDCAPGSAGHSHTHDNDVVVEFEVRVPDRIAFVGRTVNGEVSARDLDGPVEAHSVNGSVEISTDDVASASTVNGSIKATLGKSRWSDALEFETVNGGVTLRFPEKLEADVDIKTLNGDISCDFPIDVSGKISRRRLTGSIGNDPGGDLKVSTVNGSVRLVQRD